MHDVLRRRADDHATLLERIESLGRDLASTRLELSGLSFDDMAAREIPMVAGELDAIVAQSEGAADSILDGCEVLDRLGTQLAGGDRPSMREAASAVFAVTTRIYAACGFQDLTGQRVARVVAGLRAIEERMAALSLALGGRVHAADAAPEARAGLVLHGPQVPGVAMTQSDVDRLLCEVA